MIVTEIMEKTGLKRGTVDQFRSLMFDYKLITNNQSLDTRAVSVLEYSNSIKNDKNCTWEEAMDQAILIKYDADIIKTHKWTDKTIIKNLLWLIENKVIKVENVSLDLTNLDAHATYEVMIDNFVELGEYLGHYKRSMSTDANPVITYKCIGEDYVYYILGKYNSMTKNEDIHVFYNDGLKFNIMKCKHLLGGSSDGELLKDVFETCRNGVLSYEKVRHNATME